MYHVTADNQVPYSVYGNKQDGPSYRGPGNSRSGGSIPRAMWHTVAGGESGWTTRDPADRDLIWASPSKRRESRMLRRSVPAYYPNHERPYHRRGGSYR
jgi:hypothetical protein